LVLRATVEDRDDGPWVVVAVEDAGIGFGDDGTARLFEAFYTTKPSGASVTRTLGDAR
jgi:signal transduction histidine kinase